MNNRDLQQLTIQLSQQKFGRPFNHSVYFNARLRTTGGRYLLQSHDIEVNPRYYEHYGEKEVINIILHELCHYHLHLSGHGYQHKDRDFKMLSDKVGAPRFCKTIESYENRANYKYQCTACSSTYLRIRKVDTKKMRCGKCGGRLSLVEYYQKS